MQVSSIFPYLVRNTLSFVKSNKVVAAVTVSIVALIYINRDDSIEQTKLNHELSRREITSYTNNDDPNNPFQFKPRSSQRNITSATKIEVKKVDEQARELMEKENKAFKSTVSTLERYDPQYRVALDKLRKNIAMIANRSLNKQNELLGISPLAVKDTPWL